MSTIDTFREQSLATKPRRARAEWAMTWDMVSARLPDGEMPEAMIHAFEYSGWNGVIPEGGILWFGELLLTPHRLVLVSPGGLDQIRLADVGGAEYREFRVGLLKKTTHLLLTSGARVERVFSTGEDVALARAFAEALTRRLDSRPLEKFD